MKLQEQQAKKWVADEEVDNCTKCNVAFGWTVRRVCSFNRIDFLLTSILRLASLSRLSKDFL